MTILYIIAQSHHFCLDVSYIKKIIQLPELEMLPGAPEDVVGVLNYGGKIIPIYDLALLMGIEREKMYTVNTMILICAYEGKEAGLVIDSIEGQGEVIEDIHHEKEKISSDNTFLESIVTLNNKVTLIPAIKKIVARKINLNEKVQ